MFRLFVLSLCVTSSVHAAIVCFDGSKKKIDCATLGKTLSLADNVVLGEHHYTPPLQKAMAQVIAATVQAGKREGDFTVGWEFLNTRDRDRNADLFKKFTDGAIDGETFLKTTQGTDKATAYLPILDAVKVGKGELLSTNLSRAEKKPAVQGGLDAMDPKLIPPDFRLGGKNYFERFQEALGGGDHPGLKNYFVAQCLTDASMAHALLTQSKGRLRFLVAGAFHVEYRDGVVADLVLRKKTDRTVSVVFRQAESEADALAAVHHEKYGALGDYVVALLGE